MKTYIVTGGAGFIGSALATKLVKAGNRVYILDDLSTGFERNVPQSSFFYKVDVSDAEKIFSLEFPGKIDVVVHLAAQSSGETSFDNPARDIDVNYKATYNMLKLANSLNCDRFIYASSMSVYGNVEHSECIVSEGETCTPVSYYGVNKLASERLIKIFTKKTKIKETIFRLFNVYGPGQNMANIRQGMVSIYLSYLMKDTPVHVKGALDRFRDFIYIDDVIDVLTACEDCEEAHGEIFNLGTGVKTTVENLLNVMLKTYGKEDFDKWVYVHGSTLGDIKGVVANIDKLKERLKWKPMYTLSEGISEMKRWIEESVNLWK